MKIQSVDIENYGAFYGKHSFKMEGRGLVLVTGETHDDPCSNSNGAGKSTVFDAMDWALFGVVPRGDHVDSVINDEAKSCQVGVWLVDDEGRPLHIVRSRKVPDTRGLQLWHAGVEFTALDDKETQKTVEMLLGLDREIFHAAVYFAQFDSFNFADATDSERLEMLTKVLQLGRIDDFLETTKAKRDEAQNKLASLEQKVAGLEGQLAIVGEHGAGFAAQIEGYERDRAMKVAQRTQQLTEIDKYLAQAMASSFGADEARAKLAEMERTSPIVEKPAVPAEYSQRVMTCQAEMMTARTAAGDIDWRLTQLRAKKVGPCRECGQVLTGEHLEREAARLEAERNAVLARLAPLTAAVTQATAMYDAAVLGAETEFSLRKSAAEGYTQALASQRRVVAQFNEIQEYYARTLATKQGIAAELERIQKEPNPHAKAAQDAAAQAAQIKKQLAGIGTERETLQADLAHLDFWVTGFGPKGLKNYILDTRLGEMTDAANQWVKLLTGGTIWVRFETQTMGRSTGKLSNKINVRVFRYNRNGSITERGYKSWSGGEKKRVAWGISFGLSRLVAARAKKRYDTLILDEVFRHVDRAGRDAVMEMLRQIKAEKSSVFVIEHDADFSESFEHRVLVRKTNGRSQIVESDSAQEKPEAATGSDSVPTDPAIQTDGRRRPKRSPSRRAAASP